MWFAPKRLLVAVDFRDCAAAALRLALRFAETYDADLSVIHAIEPADEIPSPLARHVTLPEPGPRLSVVENELVMFIRAAVGRKPMPRYHILEGHPTEAILFASGYEKADLIVLGTRGLGGADRLTLGSVAEQVLRRSHLPVLTICPQRATRRRPSEIRRILCPVNYTPAAERAIEAGVSIARRFDAEVVALHVVEAKPVDGDVGHEEKRLRLWMRSLLPRSQKPEPLVAIGNGAAEILRYAGANDIDLIVVAARRGRSSDVTLFGTTTERVTRDAPCAVLTITQTRTET
jgi:nucleotide-binding universal stress UspA family protein